ncbi:uncharacterized protein BDR25DRAFT_304093 [Lindgomyces ingoldianus]|uniref:Uncharacterized protein n=1 Tax=Lindgomyces ingoldianus TaxID=673940 RepID=A0ACB6QU79_9PLEO|nr:uncharacterized protein BDR25DRAFT_304093 [Lindgomyces ingoldianus]KAF2470138.1 hypothetical protein BDR25DRAFT_304093 [Lindgomyces ingoldianus]
MTTPSPSEFLTFHRRLVFSSSLRYSALTGRLISCRRPVQPTYAKQFSLSSRCAQKSKSQEQSNANSEHATHKAQKGDHLDVQSCNVKEGMDSKNSGTGGHATEQRDSAGGKAKAKREFPEAPDVAIGMQDERGGRGG